MKKHTLKLLSAFLIFGMVAFFSSCDKDDTPDDGSHTAYLKATASAGCEIDMAVFGYTGNVESFTGLSGNTWQSEQITVPAGQSVIGGGVTAAGVDENSTLVLELFVDGKKVAENTGTGPVLSAQISYEP